VSAGSLTRLDLEPASLAESSQAWNVDSLLQSDFDATLSFSFYKDSTFAEKVSSGSISARRILQEQQSVPRWLSGPLCTEFLLNDTTLNPHPSINVQFQVRCYPAWNGYRISVVVENCWHDSRGNIYYDVELSVGADSPDTLFSRDSVRHWHDARWRRVFWQGDTPPRVSVKYDPAYWINSGHAPPYDVELGRSPDAVEEVYNDWINDNGATSKGFKGTRDILSWGLLKPWEPSGGAPPELGIFSAYAVNYLLTMDPRAEEVLLGHGEQVASYPVHLRDRTTNRVPTIDNYPTINPFHFKESYHFPYPRGDMFAPISLARDKLGSFVYMPYLITGDYFFLEEAYFLANFVLIAGYPPARQNDKGILYGCQRDAAWSLRAVAEAAVIAPDGSQEKSYFNHKLNNTLDYALRHISTEDSNNTFGFYGLPEDESGRSIRDLPDWVNRDSVHSAISPWMAMYLIAVTDYVSRLGYPRAEQWCDFMLRFPVGQVANHPAFNKYDAPAYRFARTYTCTECPGGWRLPTDWADLWRLNFADREPSEAPSDWKEYTYFGHTHQHLLFHALTIAVQHEIPQAQSAWSDLYSHLQKTGISTHARECKAPQWWLRKPETLQQPSSGTTISVPCGKRKFYWLEKEHPQRIGILVQKPCAASARRIVVYGARGEFVDSVSVTAGSGRATWDVENVKSAVYRLVVE
jgi:hypothetical protein